MTASNSIPAAARLRRAIELAALFLSQEGIRLFPIDPLPIIARRGWTLKTYTCLAKSQGYEDPYEVSQLIRHVFGTGDAFAVMQGGRYLIAYNENARPPQRIHFSLMHEVGHIVLGHLADFPCGRTARQELTEREYRVLEEEADCFARNTLTPAILAMQLSRMFSPESCMRVFGLSAQAWTTRLRLLSDDYARLTLPQRALQREQFWGFITGKICLGCGAKIIGLRRGQHCPFCGGTDFVWRGDIAACPDIYTLPAGGAPLPCPACGEAGPPAGEPAIACGGGLAAGEPAIACGGGGLASGAGLSPLGGAARYCILCGAEAAQGQSQPRLPRPEAGEEKGNRIAKNNRKSRTRPAPLPDGCELPPF